MLEVSALTTRYGAIAALRDADLHVGSGEVVGLIGPNGAGKTTLLNTIAGLLTPAAGQVRFEGQDVTGAAPERLLRAGLALVPEHRRIFPDLTVEENLKIGSITVSGDDRHQLLEEMAEQFPVLKLKWDNPAGFLSGGEAQQLAIARALMSRPRLIMMDEVSLGLAPPIVRRIYDALPTLLGSGCTILLVEQDVQHVLSVASHVACFLEGKIALHGAPSELTNEQITKAYFGV